MKKNNFKSLAAVLSLAMAATAIPVNANAAAAPKLTVSDTTVYSGRTYSMTVKNLKKGYTVQFSSTQGGVKFATKKVTSKGAKVAGEFTVKAAKNIADGTKTKIKAVVKNANGKKVKSLTKQVTLKQLAKTLTLKDIVQTTVKVGDTVNADATIAPAAAKGAYKKVFSSSDSSVLEVTKASTGLFKAVAPGTATIQVTASNGDETVSGSKTITITVEAAEDNDNSGTVTPGTPDNDNTVTTPTGPAILNDYELTLALRDGKSQITANGIDQTIVDVTLAPPTDLEDLEGIGNMKVAVDLVLGTANVGSLSQNRLTLNYNITTKKWEGYVVFTSATLNSTMTSNIVANVASVIDAPVGALDGKQLNGKSSNAVDIQLVPAQAEEVQTGQAADAIKAVVESCDRMIITFSRNVTPEEFLKTGTTTPDPDKFELYVQRDASDSENGSKISDQMSKKQSSKYYYTDKVVGILPVSGRSDQLEFVFAAGAELADNSRFFAKFVDIRNGVSTESRMLGDRIVDTSVPTVMSVEPDGMNAIIVKFDQPVVHYLTPVWSSKNNSQDQQLIPWTSDTSEEKVKQAANVSALALKNFSIDGRNLGDNATVQFFETRNNGTEDWALYGEAGINDNNGLYRDTIRIVLGKADNNKKGSARDFANNGSNCYFTAGEHVLQIANVGDYASISDPNNNKVATQTFRFNVAENTAAPSFTVEAQSVEQVVLNFSTKIQELEDVKIGERVPTTNNGLGANLKLRYQDGTDWKELTKDTEDFYGFDLVNGKAVKNSEIQGLQITRIADDPTTGNHRVKVEVTKDWTMLYGYAREGKDGGKSYISRNFQLFLAADSIHNVYNGKVNAELHPSLTHLQNYDGQSPTITAINEVAKLDGQTRTTQFDIVFDEPVQAGNDVFQYTKDTSAITPGYNNAINQYETLGTMSVEIVNTATKKVYSTKIVGYSPEDLEDKTIRVEVVQYDDNEIFPAGDYELYARYVSDDAGNTVRTDATKFNYGGPAAAGFKVLSVLADKGSKGVAGGNGLSTGDGLTTANNDTAHDYIYVEFSTTYSVDVLIQNNWTLNGVALPVGSYIEAGIQGTDIATNRCVTIVLPDNYLTRVDNTNLRINANVKGVASNGSSLALEGQYTFNTPAIFVGSTFNATDRTAIYMDRFGNNSWEQINATVTTLENK